MTHIFPTAGLAAGACGLLLAAQAQTSPLQGTNQPGTNQPAADYRATSLEPDDPFALPRTPEGRPDFQGVVWHANFFAFLQGAPGSELVIAEDKAKAAFQRALTPFRNVPGLALDPEATDLIEAIDGFPIVRGERRTRLLVQPASGRMPFTPEAAKELAAPVPRQDKLDNPEERDSMERCIAPVGSAHLPPAAILAPVPNARQFFQTRDHVVIHAEYFDEVRIIPFASARKTNAPPSLMGDSVAHWDGDTLVIETINLPLQQRRRGPIPSFIVNPDAKVIERFTRVSEAELLYQFTIEDPKVYAAPWLAEYSYFRAPFRIFPSGCHEANYSLPNILRGQRVADARAAEKK